MNSSRSTCRPFGELPGGELIEAWKLEGAGGLTVEAMTFGASITRLLLPDGTDVVLGFDDLAPYVGEHPYFGAMVGRVAGRLTGARFQLEGRSSQLRANDGNNTLHGGPSGFDKRVWRATNCAQEDGSPCVRFSLRSADGDQGFPGDLDVGVEYLVTPDNTLLIKTIAATNKATPLSLTNHTYFNLAGTGCGEDLLDHELQVNCKAYVPADKDFTLQDRAEPVGAANDLRHPRRLREAVQSFHAQHGDMYLTDAKDSVGPVAKLTHPTSGWMMECFTTAPCLQLYTGSHIKGPIRGKGRVAYGRFAGLCLECQNYPNAVNAPHLDAAGILLPDMTQRTTTAYKFSAYARGGCDESNR